MIFPLITGSANPGDASVQVQQQNLELSITIEEDKKPSDVREQVQATLEKDKADLKYGSCLEYKKLRK